MFLLALSLTNCDIFIVGLEPHSRTSHITLRSLENQGEKISMRVQIETIKLGCGHTKYSFSMFLYLRRIII